MVNPYESTKVRAQMRFAAVLHAFYHYIISIRTIKRVHLYTCAGGSSHFLS